MTSVLTRRVGGADTQWEAMDSRIHTTRTAKELAEAWDGRPQSLQANPADTSTWGF